VERRQQERLVGAIVVVVLASVAVPWLLDGSPEALRQDGQSPIGDVETRIVTVDLGNPDPTPIIEAPAPPVVVPVPRERNEGGGQASSAGTGQSGGAGASSSASGPPGTGRDTLPDRAAKASPERVSSPASGQVGAAEASSGNRAPAPDDGDTDSVVVAGWAVQVGSFRSRENAQGLADSLAASGYRAFLARHSRGGQTWYRVRVGTEQTRGAAEEIQARLRRDGESTTIVRHP
jgi:DedD protein